MSGSHGDGRYGKRYRSDWPPRFRGQPPEASTVTVALACGHTNTYDAPAPSPETSGYCRLCKTYTHVTKETAEA